MKKAKLNSKLNLKKEQITNLNEVKGGISTWNIQVCATHKCTLDPEICITMSCPNESECC